MTPLKELVRQGLVQPYTTAAPGPGSGVALDGNGRLPTSAPATALPVYTADPVILVNGMVWLRSDLNELRSRISGVTYKWAGTAV